MFRFKSALIIASLVVLMGLMLPVTVLAFSGGAITAYEVTCEFATITYEEILFDRDNTGVNAEETLVTIFDGNGNVLFSINQQLEVGGGFSAQTEVVPFAVPATANPIRLLGISVAGNGLPEQVFWDISADCADLPPSTVAADPPGPGVPAGFVLVTITCDVAVYDTPAGSPVGDNAVRAGQTWFVNPESVEGDDGRQWTEIFVSSRINPYIPTACIG